MNQNSKAFMDKDVIQKIDGLAENLEKSPALGPEDKFFRKNKYPTTDFNFDNNGGKTMAQSRRQNSYNIFSKVQTDSKLPDLNRRSKSAFSPQLKPSTPQNKLQIPN